MVKLVENELQKFTFAPTYKLPVGLFELDFGTKFVLQVDFQSLIEFYFLKTKDSRTLKIFTRQSNFDISPEQKKETSPRFFFLQVVAIHLAAYFFIIFSAFLSFLNGNLTSEISANNLFSTDADAVRVLPNQFAVRDFEIKNRNRRGHFLH